MKILIINEFVRLGGAEQIVKNQRELLISKGHDVRCLCFNYGNISDTIDGYDVIESKFKLNKIIFNPFYYYRLRKYIKNFKADKIIVHSMFSSPITQYLCIRGFESVQVIHDYYVVCPNYLCVRLDSDNKVCEGYKCKKCIKECYHHGSKLNLIIKLYITKITEVIRKKYIKLCITPSKKLKEYLNKYNYKAICINNPIESNEKLENEIIREEITKYIYAGGINDHKGILDFLKEFIEFSKNKKVQLDIYGPISDEESKQKLEYYLDSNKNIKYFGCINNNKLIEKIKKSKFLIVPSKWMENYPTVVLEAMINGVVVIGSNRGGIPELLANNRGLVYECGISKSIISTLERSLEISEYSYSEIRKEAFNYIRTNNSYETYYKRLCEAIGIS